MSKCEFEVSGTHGPKICPDCGGKTKIVSYWRRETTSSGAGRTFKRFLTVCENGEAPSDDMKTMWNGPVGSSPY